MDDLYPIFEQYLNDELEGDALEQFEEGLRTNKDVRVQFDLYKGLQEDLQFQFETEENSQSAENAIRSIHKSHFKAKKQNQGAKIRSLSFARWAAAASVLLLLMAAWWLLPSTEEDALVAFSDYPTLSLTTRSDIGNEERQRAEQHFNNKEYKAALADLTAIYKQDSLVKVLLFKGLAAMEAGEHSLAENIFSELEKEEDYKEASPWYQALNLVKQDKKAEANQLLKSIPTESDYYQKAQLLVKALE